MCSSYVLELVGALLKVARNVRGLFLLVFILEEGNMSSIGTALCLAAGVGVGVGVGGSSLVALSLFFFFLFLGFLDVVGG